MIDIQLWRVRIGCFRPRRKPVSSMKTMTLSRGSVSLTLKVIIALSLCVVLSGDVETNPGPEIEEILSEIRNMREENKRNFQDIKKTINDVQNEMKTVKKDIEEIKDQMNTQQLDMDAVYEEVEANKIKINSLAEDMEKMERYSRRENIIIYGITEREHEKNSEIKTTVKNILNENSAEKAWVESDFVRAHRLGAKSPSSSRPRPIIVRLVNHDDKFIILAARDRLKNKGLGVSNDLTQGQRDELQKLKEEGKRGFYKGGKLHVDPNPPPFRDNVRERQVNNEQSFQRRGTNSNRSAWRGGGRHRGGRGGRGSHS